MDDEVDAPTSDRDDLLEDLLENHDNEEAEGENQTNDDGNVDDNEAEATTEGAADEENTKKPVKKRVVLKPRPKLNPERLCGKRGIPILPSLFEKVKFKGKGNEREDLNCMMSMLEHWGHRLFPIMTFDTLLSGIEKLGTKKPVQVCVKKMRLGMPILDEDFVTQREDDDDEVIEREHTVDDPGMSNNDQDAFEQLLRNTDGIAEQEQSSSLTTTQSVPINPKPTVVITDEMRERMETNKRLAMEKRKQKLLDKQAMSKKNPEETDCNSNVQREISQTSTHKKDCSEEIELIDSQVSKTFRTDLESDISGVNNSQDPSSNISELAQSSKTFLEFGNDGESKQVLESVCVEVSNNIFENKLKNKSISESDQNSEGRLNTELLDEDQLLEEMWGNQNVK